MFCGCELSFGDPPNTHTCAVCLGLPGSLPVANARAIHFGLMIGLALGSELAPRSIFHRKNYFYPDLPKGYQISQYDEPLCRGGRLGEVRIHRVHLEEDAAKLIHVGASGRIHGSDASVVDFNRGGTPLAEIVTEPDLRSAEQAGEWLKLLRTTLRQLGVSDVNMEEGSLRCDANISLRPAGSARARRQDRAEEHELVPLHRTRHQGRDRPPGGILRGGGAGRRRRRCTSTRISGAITSLRSKEEAHDYRYFPEPDLVPVAIDEEMLDAAAGGAGAAGRPRRAASSRAGPQRRQRAAARLPRPSWATTSRRRSPPRSIRRRRAQALANWITVELRRARLGGRCEDPGRLARTARALAALVGLVAAKRISVGAGRQVLDRLVAEGGDPATIVQAEGLARSAASDELAQIVAAALAANRRRRRARARGQRQGDRPDRGPRDARDQGPRRRRRGHAAGARAARPEAL